MRNFNRDDYLFLKSDMFAVKENQQRQMLAEIDRVAGDELLNANVDDLLALMLSKYSLSVPVLKEDEIHQSGAEDVRIDVSRHPDRYIRDRSRPFHIPGTSISIYVPFDGDAGMFRVKPSSSYMNPLRGGIGEGELIYSTQGPQLEGGQVLSAFNGWLAEVKQYLAWQHQDLRGYNDGLASAARQLISQRRTKLLADRGLAQSLGFPLRRRQGAPTTYRAPEVKRKIAPRTSPSATATFTPEPELDAAEYEHILGVISNMVHVMERSPKAFYDLDEEGIRTHFLVQLNGQYEGQATGETFNYEGKTDILIRSGGRNIFIAECKFWDGPAKFTETIDQLLRYLSWRDSKAAIVMFNRNKDFSKVLAAIPDVAKAHPNFLKEEGKRGETAFRFALRHKDDPAKLLHLTTLVFDVPRPA